MGIGIGIGIGSMVIRVGGSRAVDAHVPVLSDQVIALTAPRPGHTVLDGTVGAGGHAAAILPLITPGGHLHGCDLDADALEIARERLAPWADQVTLRHGSFADAPDTYDIILLDLGVSSIQLDSAERGFGLRADGPLDMRMDVRGATTAATLVNELPESELADIIHEYGEERRARRVARAIVDARPIETTLELARVVSKAVGGPRLRIHPATRTFQALRIAVNGELAALDRALAELPARLAPGGRMAVISSHSLEDRRVKHAFAALAKTDAYELVTRKPVQADATEVARNRRSRSAKLRVLSRGGVS